jgi:hypothetical protein
MAALSSYQRNDATIRLRDFPEMAAQISNQAQEPTSAEPLHSSAEQRECLLFPLP